MMTTQKYIAKLAKRTGRTQKEVRAFLRKKLHNRISRYELAKVGVTTQAALARMMIHRSRP